MSLTSSFINNVDTSKGLSGTWHVLTEGAPQGTGADLTCDTLEVANLSDCPLLLTVELAPPKGETDPVTTQVPVFAEQIKTYCFDDACIVGYTVEPLLVPTVETPFGTLAAGATTKPLDVVVTCLDK